jgi:hypothetical protein
MLGAMTWLLISKSSSKTERRKCGTGAADRLWKRAAAVGTPELVSKARSLNHATSTAENEREQK